MHDYKDDLQIRVRREEDIPARLRGDAPADDRRRTRQQLGEGRILQHRHRPGGDEPPGQVPARTRRELLRHLAGVLPRRVGAAARRGAREERLRALYIDNYLLHSIGNGGLKTFSKRYLDNGALDWCAELREQKRIRNLGFSFHGDKKAFDWCIEHHDKYKWDFCQIQMNYVDWHHAQEVNKRNLDGEWLYKTLTDNNIPVVIMEPLLGGRLARFNYAIAAEMKPLDPEASLAKWAFRFCGTYPNVMTVLSGMTFMQHVKENVETFSPLKPCSERELEALERAARAYLSQNAIPCNYCNYCMPCPYGLDIPAILTFRNEYLTAKEKPSAREALAAYAKAVPEELRRAEHCIGCRRCVPHCPQSIDIPGELAAIDAWIDTLKAEVVNKKEGLRWTR